MWIRQLRTQFKFAEQIYEIYEGCEGRILLGSTTLTEFEEFLHNAQSTLVNDVAKLSHTLEETGRFAEAMLVSKLLDEGSESFFVDDDKHLLRAQIDRLDRIGDFATAEMLQRNLVAHILRERTPDEMGVDLIKEIDRLQSFHTKYATRLKMLLEGWEVDIGTRPFITPIFHYVDLLQGPYSLETIMDYHPHMLTERDLLGRTVLHVAIDGQRGVSLWWTYCSLSSNDIFRQFPVNRRDIFGRTAFHAMCQKNIHARSQRYWEHERVAKLLLSRGDIEPDTENAIERTPLSYAAENGYEEFVKLLLEHGNVRVDSKDSHARAPLHYAAIEEHETVVKLLLEH